MVNPSVNGSINSINGKYSEKCKEMTTY